MCVCLGFLFFLEGGGNTVVDIDRMTKNPNQRFVFCGRLRGKVRGTAGCGGEGARATR